MYTYLWTIEQLERALDLRDSGVVRIIHIVCEDGPVWDQYVTMVDCDPYQALLLHLI